MGSDTASLGNSSGLTAQLHRCAKFINHTLERGVKKPGHSSKVRGTLCAEGSESSHQYQKKKGGRGISINAIL